MIKKRITKAVISFMLIVSVVFCSSLSAFAYRAVIDIKSDEWEIVSDDTYSAVYPERIPQYPVPPESAYSHEELNGYTYYASNFWDDNYQHLTDVKIQFPALKTNETKFGAVILRSGDMFWLAYFEDTKVQVGISQNELIYKMSINDYRSICRLDYPFSAWVLADSANTSSAGVVKKFSALLYDLEIIWSNIDIYGISNGSFSSSVVYKADNYGYSAMLEKTYEFELYKPLTVLTGTLSFELTSDELKKLTSGAYCLRLDDCGFIVGGKTSLVVYSYALSLHQNGNYLGSLPLSSETLYEDPDDSSDNSLPIGYSYFKDYVDFIDIDSTFESGDVSLVIVFMFVSNGFNLIFPGNLELIEFESYEEQVKHDEISGELNEISGTLEDLYNDIPDAIKNELEPIINSSTVGITESVNSASQSITDKLQAVKEGIENKLQDVKEGINEKLEDVKNGLLDGIESFFVPTEEAMEEVDDQWDELLKSRFGALYEVSDIVTDFADEMSWDYIKQAGEKNTITMPSVTVMLVDTNFTFGGYEVSIVPEGFDVLTTALKGITAIVCTLLFINALRKRYDKLVGGNSV